MRTAAGLTQAELAEALGVSGQAQTHPASRRSTAPGEIFRLYTEARHGTRAIAGELNRRGVRTRTGALWSGYTITASSPTPHTSVTSLTATSALCQAAVPFMCYAPPM
jgi:hypothetical protein